MAVEEIKTIVKILLIAMIALITIGGPFVYSLGYSRGALRMKRHYMRRNDNAD